MARLESFQVKNCFGFGDSGRVKLDNPHNINYVLGRNSSGKASFLNAIKYFAYSLRPENYPNYTNFRPTEEQPRLIAEFSVEAGDLSPADIAVRIRRRFRKRVPESVVQADQRIARFMEEAESHFQQLIANVVQQEHVWIERL
jgi:DNA repair exonuclease SbcCD ATPase subunit